MSSPGEQAAAMHRDGVPLTEIAERLGVDAYEAWRLIDDALTRQEQLEAEQARRLEAERLDVALARAMAILRDDEAPWQAHAAMAKIVVTVSARRAAMRGLDLGGPGTKPVERESAMLEPRRLIQELRAEADRIESQLSEAN